MTRILLIVENETVPFDVRVWAMARTLRDDGYAVTVICPTDPLWSPERHEVIDDIEIHRFPVRDAKGVRGYLLEYTWALAWITFLVVRLRKQKFAAVHLNNPPDILFLPALLLRRTGTRVVFDHHDLSPELYRSKVEHPSRIVNAALRLLELLTFRIADLVISTNESYRSIAIGRGGKDPNDVVVIRNGPDLCRLRVSEPDPTLHNGRSILLGYIGSMGHQDGVDQIIHAIDELTHHRGRDDLQTIIVGSGPELPTLRGLTTKLALDGHIHFTGRVTDEDLVTIANTIDIGLCPDPYSPLNDISTMNKTMEYMALSKPTVAYDLLETRVSAGDSALYAAPGNTSDFAGCIEKLADSPELRAELGSIGRRRIEDGLSWDHSADRLVEAYRHLLAD